MFFIHQPVVSFTQQLYDYKFIVWIKKHNRKQSYFSYLKIFLKMFYCITFRDIGNNLQSTFEITNLLFTAVTLKLWPSHCFCVVSSVP